MELIQFEQNGVKYLVVEVPEKSFDFDIKVSKFLYPGFNVLSYKSPIIWDLCKRECWISDTKSEYDLTIISTLSEITEEQAAEMVDKGQSFGYYDYNDNEFVLGLMFYDLAILSLKSRIRSLGGSDDANYVILKEVMVCKHENIISSDGCDECQECGARNY